MGSKTSITFKPIISKLAEQNHKRIMEKMLSKPKPEFKKLLENRQLESIYLGLFQRFRKEFISAGTIQSEFAENAPLAVSWSCTVITKDLLYNQAQNVLNLTLCYRSLKSPSSRACALMNDMSLRLLDGCQDILMDLKPDLIFKGWAKIYSSNNDKTKQTFFQWLTFKWGSNILEKYGIKVAAQLFSEQVLTGNVYRAKSPLQCEYTDILGHLLLASISIIEKDLQVQKLEEKNLEID